MTNWWVDESGRNNLAGVEDDPTNPPVLPDATIIEYLIRMPVAQAAYREILPYMLPAERARLNALTAAHPRTLQPYVEELVEGEQFQQRMNNTAFFDPNRRRR